MKTLRVFLGVGAVVALLGLSVATAEIRNDSIKPLTFSVDVGDGSASMQDVSFDSSGGAGGEEAQSTCAMVPGGAMPNLLLAQPPIVLPKEPEHLTQAPDVELASLNPLRTPPTYRRDYFGPGRDLGTIPGATPDLDPEHPPVVPEPATLLLVGLGLGVATWATRRRREL